MADKHGDFIWYELMTTDADSAQNFYGKILGWTYQDSGQQHIDYRMFSVKDNPIGGVIQLSDEMKAGGAQSCWMGYINVENVDAQVAAIKSAGGSIHIEPWDIPNVGRAALVSDPQGAMIYIMTAQPPAGNPDATSKAFAATEPMIGHCAWNELASTDQAGAVDFYTKQFGWRQEDDMDMGPMGTYHFFHHGPAMIGAVMAKPDEMPVSAWTYYFRVADIDEAIEAIKANGGAILLEPTEIPGGEYSMTGMDPQGAAFALIGPRK